VSPAIPADKKPGTAKDLLIVIAQIRGQGRTARQYSYESLFRDHEDIQTGPSYDLFSELRG